MNHPRANPILALLKPVATACIVMVLAACGPREVQIQTAPRESADVTIRFTNNLLNAVNVYVTADGQDWFLRQVGPNRTENLPAAGLSVGTRVTLKATVVDGSRTYQRADVRLESLVPWQVP